MQFICEALVSDADRKRRGVHICDQLVEKAIEGKNARLSSRSLATDRATLCPADFGAALTDRAEKLRQQVRFGAVACRMPLLEFQATCPQRWLPASNVPKGHGRQGDR
jgi:hypothetical protein